jgi:peroxiredoxin
MAEQSTMLPLGTVAPSFHLPDPNGNQVSLDNFPDASAFLVVFLCNHCPYVKHVQSSFTQLARDYQARGVAVVAINSNDVEAHPEDRPEKMAEEILNAGYTFPYVFDETQNVAKAYGAACTPDFFLFDKERRLAYRGQYDASRPKNGLPVTGADLRASLEAVLNGRPQPVDQKPSVGCGIKWKRQNAGRSAN